MIQPWNRKCDRSKERRTSLDVNRRDMGREGEVILLLIPFLRSSQPSSRFFLPFPRGWSVAAEFDKLERLKWIRARHRPRFYRNTERERERDCVTNKRNGKILSKRSKKRNDRIEEDTRTSKIFLHSTLDSSLESATESGSDLHPPWLRSWIHERTFWGKISGKREKREYRSKIENIILFLIIRIDN